MRTTRLMMIIVWSIVAVILLMALVGGIYFSRRNTSGSGALSDQFTRSSLDGNEVLHVDETFDGDSINSVAFSLGADDVDIYPSDDGDLRVMQYGVNLEEGRIITATQRGSSLSITRRGDSGIQFGFGFNTKSTVEIYLPDKVYKELDLHLSSGNLYIHTDLDADKFKARLSSGNIKANGDVRAERAEVKITSGDARMAGVYTGRYELEVSSGLLEVSGLSGTGSTELTSGDMRLWDVELTGDLSSKVSSGSLDIEIAGDPGFEFKGRRSSGDIRTYFDVDSRDDRDKEVFATVGSGPYVDFTVQVTSGTVRINAA